MKGDLLRSDEDRQQSSPKHCPGLMTSTSEPYPLNLFLLVPVLSGFALALVPGVGAARASDTALDVSVRLRSVSESTWTDIEPRRRM